ncbi:hypothetical protein DRJ48_04290 [Candidatus Woesearchaeota archaeon]|nr:SdpI family protein [Candidatus Woesearchaeota archaeon]RLE42070.1 MAG: hypothetical protein DRJ48_04290 [Candidatus Woesearchaeota archaeon]
MKISRYDLMLLGLVLVGMVFGLALYNKLPERVAIHWNAQGMPDSYAHKALLVFLMPGLGLVFWWLMRVIPNIEPFKANIQKFIGSFNLFIVAMVAFLLYIQVASIAYNLGFGMDLSKIILPGIAIIIYLAGVLTEKSKRNYFIGIRTPWTLSSDKVWDKTNTLGGRLFRIAALFILASTVLPGKWAFILTIALVLGVACFTIFYSYFLFAKTKGKNKRLIKQA